MRRRGVRQPAPAGRPTAGVVLNFEARGLDAARPSCSRPRGATPAWSACTATRCPTRSAPASPSRCTGSSPTTPTSPRSASRTGSSASTRPTSTARPPTTRPRTRRPYMDQASLQHHGGNALALARAFGDGRPRRRWRRPSAGDATYFPVPGLLVRYPGWLVWPLAGRSRCSAVLALAVLARPSRADLVARLPRPVRPRPGAAAAGAGAGPGAVVVLTADPARVPGDDRPLAAGLVPRLRARAGRGHGAALVRVAAPPDRPVAAGHRGAWRGSPCSASCSPRLTPGGSYLAALPALAGAVAGIIALFVRAAGPGWSRSRSAARWRCDPRPDRAAVLPRAGLATGGAAAFFAAMLGLALLPRAGSTCSGPAAAPWLPALPVAARPGASRSPCVAVGLAVGPVRRRAPRARPSSCTPSTPTPARPGGFSAEADAGRVDQPVRQRPRGPRGGVPDPRRRVWPPARPRRPTCRRRPSTWWPTRRPTVAARCRCWYGRSASSGWSTSRSAGRRVRANVAGRPVPGGCARRATRSGSSSTPRRRRASG